MLRLPQSSSSFFVSVYRIGSLVQILEFTSVFDFDYSFLFGQLLTFSLSASTFNWETLFSLLVVKILAMPLLGLFLLLRHHAMSRPRIPTLGSISPLYFHLLHLASVPCNAFTIQDKGCRGESQKDLFDLLGLFRLQRLSERLAGPEKSLTQALLVARSTLSQTLTSWIWPI